MVGQKQDLYRKESLDRLSSPERLDQLMQVVRPKSWLPLVSLGSIVAVAVVWSVYGRIPVTVEGRGVLIYPRNIVPIQSQSAGQLLALNVKVGDSIKKGDVLAIVDQTDLRKQLQLQNAKLAQLELQNRNVSVLQSQRSDLDKKALQQQRQTLEQSLQATQSLTPVIRDKGLVAIQQDRQNLQQRLKAISEILPVLKQRWENRKKLLAEGAVAADSVLQARQDYLNSLSNVSDAESEFKQLDVKEADAQRQYLENLNTIKNLKAQIQELSSKEANFVQKDLESSTNRDKEIQEVKREIAQLQQRLSANSEIISQYNGRVLEITLSPGQVVSAGARLGSINVQNSSKKQVGITYFTIADGKKIQPGMPVQITPQTVKRERFGGIVGKVTNVSSFPITKEAAAYTVGNPEVVEGLIAGKQDGLIQIFSELETDSISFSGYKWSSSQGPQMKISPGTTTSVRVKVDERAPITFVIPTIKSLTGIY